MRPLPEKWTLLRANPSGALDPSTGHPVPSAPTEVEWTGLLQLRLIDTRQDEITPDVAVSEMILLLTPGLPGGTSRRDRWRFDGPADVSDLLQVGDVVTVQGTPRVRRPARGSRRAAYIAAIVKHSTDLEG